MAWLEREYRPWMGAAFRRDLPSAVLVRASRESNACDPHRSYLYQPFAIRCQPPIAGHQPSSNSRHLVGSTITRKYRRGTSLSRSPPQS